MTLAAKSLMYSVLRMEVPHRWSVAASAAAMVAAVISPRASFIRAMTVSAALPEICWATMLRTMA